MSVEDFEFSINDGDWQNFEEDGENEQLVDAGYYYVVENEMDNYETTYMTCGTRFEIERDASELTDLNGDLLYIGLGEEKHCYIYNTFVEVDLEVDKDDNGVTAQAGGQYDYTLDIKNNSEDFAATEVIVTDTLDSNLKFVSYEGQDWICSLAGESETGFGGTLTCEYQMDLEPETVAPTITITVEVSANPTGTSIVNVAEVESKEFDTDTTNNKDIENTPIFKPQVLGEVTVKAKPAVLVQTGQNNTSTLIVGLSLILAIVLVSRTTTVTKKYTLK